MAKNLQNYYTSFEAAEAAAKRRTEKDGEPRGVWATAEGYWEPMTLAEIDHREALALAWHQAALNALHRPAAPGSRTRRGD
jgi:hypothetical protein